MPKVVKVFLLLLCAWLLLNVGPTLIYAFSRTRSLFDFFIMLCSGSVWGWSLQYAPAFILLARGVILFFALKLWLRKPNLFAASVLVAVGPMVAPTWALYLAGELATAGMIFCSAVAVLGGFLLQGFWGNRKRSAPFPSAPMSTYHH